MYSNKLICNILNYLDQNINRNVSIDELYKTFHYNKTYIMKLFKIEIGIPIKLYMNKVRVYNSLKHYSRDSHILRIAIKNGFNSLEYYPEVFKSVVGVSPIIYKNFQLSRLYVDENAINTISLNISELKIFIENIEKYKVNIKPITNPIKKFTLFK